MRLIMSPPSPFARKCRVLIREVGLADRVEEVNVSTTPLASDPAILSANPTGKIPVLVRKDGPAIYDSRVICRFLDDLAESGLYPESRLWDVLTLEASADAIMDSAVSMAYEKRLRPAENQSADWIEAQWGKIARMLDAIETRWMPLLQGRANMAQIAVACALSYIDLRHDGRRWRDGRLDLSAWHAEFSAREAMEETRPD